MVCLPSVMCRLVTCWLGGSQNQASGSSCTLRRALVEQRGDLGNYGKRGAFPEGVHEGRRVEADAFDPPQPGMQL